MSSISSVALGLVPAALGLLALVPFAAGAAEPRIVADPPLLQPAVPARASLAGGSGRPPLAASPAGGREVKLDLNITYTDAEIYNPAANRNDKVRLRSYQGDRVDPASPFIAPMVMAEPGQTIRITLHNQLPSDPTCTPAHTDVNTPHCFNATNLHAHGLWVSPSGNSDNVLLSINPGKSFQYEYNIPEDHPAGTFWYHTHRHGSTALQVSSGMAGALVIKGHRQPTATQPGDLDTLLKATPSQSFRERVVVLQQIAYACRDGAGVIKLDANKAYRCDPGDVGGVEGYDQLGSSTWPASGRYTSINGQVLPTFSGARTGQIERWRVIHGGVRETINLQFRKLRPNAPGLQGLRAAANDRFVSDNCTGAALPQHLVAADGITLNAAIQSTETVLQPGYRWDALMVFPEAGTYCVIDGAVPVSASVNQDAPSRRLLGLVQVAQGAIVPPDLRTYLTEELVKAARLNMAAAMGPLVEQQLRDQLSLRNFAPHPDIQDAELTGKQELTFNISFSSGKPSYEVDGTTYDPADPTRVRRLLLDGVDEWTLKSDFVGHPFHIHVNPFQIVRILDATGRDVSAADAQDGAGGSIDPQYRALKGVWKDTLWVKNTMTPDAKQGQYTVVVRTRYRRYIGDFVLHCHILDHEDQGMMQNVRIALPEDAAAGGHAHH